MLTIILRISQTCPQRKYIVLWLPELKTFCYTVVNRRFQIHKVDKNNFRFLYALYYFCATYAFLIRTKCECRVSQSNSNVL